MIRRDPLRTFASSSKPLRYSELYTYLVLSCTLSICFSSATFLFFFKANLYVKATVLSNLLLLALLETCPFFVLKTSHLCAFCTSRLKQEPQ